MTQAEHNAVRQAVRSRLNRMAHDGTTSILNMKPYVPYQMLLLPVLMPL